MANINLLPWREERRQEQKKEFFVVLGGVAIIAIGLIFLTHMYVRSSIDYQNSRNQYLSAHIAELDKQAKEIKELEKTRQQMLDRMHVIQQLQGNRPVIVRIFDELVRTLPDGVFYKSLKRDNDRIVVEGIAESNNRISSLMRKIEASEWFSGPNLTSVKADPSYGDQASSFTLSFSISSPSDKNDKEG